eukprot:gene13076-13178_t
MQYFSVFSPAIGIALREMWVQGQKGVIFCTPRRVFWGLYPEGEQPMRVGTRIGIGYAESRARAGTRKNLRPFRVFGVRLLKMVLRTALAVMMMASPVLPAVAQTTAPPAGPAGPPPAVPAPAGAPAAAATPDPICTDRPTRSTFACTTPGGRVLIEADAINWAHDAHAGVSTDTVAYSNPVFKLGVDGATDIEAAWTPWTTVRTHDAGGTTTLSGTGDVVLRIKHRLTRANAGFSIALVPYVKIPLARAGIGNGHWEGGVVAGTNIVLTPSLLLTFAPEIDFLADRNDFGRRHVQTQQTINLGKSITPQLMLYGELMRRMRRWPGSCGPICNWISARISG